MQKSEWGPDFVEKGIQREMDPHCISPSLPEVHSGALVGMEVLGM